MSPRKKSGAPLLCSMRRNVVRGRGLNERKMPARKKHTPRHFPDGLEHGISARLNLDIRLGSTTCRRRVLLF